jgi:uncharacterized membrane protein
MNEILNLIWITLLPFLELRASIPYGILNTDMHWFFVFFICVITNIILGFILYFFIKEIIWIATRIGFIENIYHKYVEKTQKKIDKYVEKYGELAIAVFIGIPLPGSGVYSGALAAYLIGLSKRKFIIACIIGVLIAGILVTIVSLTSLETLKIFIKNV